MDVDDQPIYPQRDWRALSPRSQWLGLLLGLLLIALTVVTYFLAVWLIIFPLVGLFIDRFWKMSYACLSAALAVPSVGLGYVIAQHIVG